MKLRKPTFLNNDSEQEKILRMFLTDNLRKNLPFLNVLIMGISVVAVMMFVMKLLGFDYNFPLTNYYLIAHLLLIILSFSSLLCLEKNKDLNSEHKMRIYTRYAHLFVTGMCAWAVVISCFDLSLIHHPTMFFATFIAIPFLCPLEPVFLSTITVIGTTVLLIWQRYIIGYVDYSFTIGLIIYATLACVIIFRTNQIMMDNYKLQSKLKEESLHDGLTNLKNRRALEQEIEVLRTHDVWVNIIILDIDDFKSINDSFGHQKGDECLKLLAASLKEHFPDNEIFRYGGDEFVLLTRFGREDIHCKLGETNARLALGEGGVKFHISGGFCSYNGQESITAVESRADQALYEAKQSGKRCFVEFSNEKYVEPFTTKKDRIEEH